MCGICGISGLENKSDIDYKTILAMANSLRHRGPDDEGIWCSGSNALGFRRLSIIDLSADGNQPFVNETGEIRSVCNGEIYNYKELRQKLISCGHQFSSQSDCEVVLHAYESYGLDFVHHLNGMFAIAILDKQENRLVLVRDRLGIKPLYYHVNNDRIHFASELKGILADAKVPRGIDPLALNLFFVKEVIPAPFTIYKNIKKLAAGEMLIVDLQGRNEKFKTVKYWEADFTPDYQRKAADFQEELEALLSDAIDIHSVSDVPVGIFLSGGLDSSAIFSYLKNHSGEPIQSFNIGFDDLENDESKIAERLAKDWGASHRQLRLEKTDVIQLLNRIVLSYDEPFGDSSAVPTYLISQLASKHVKVVLSGDGGDELFSGYITGRGAKNIDIACQLPDFWRMNGAAFLDLVRPSNSLKRLKLPTWLMLASLRDHLFDPLCRNILKPHWQVPRDDIWATYEPLKEKLTNLHPVNAYFAGLFAQYLADDILPKVDIASSAHSLETRVPLLDYRIVALAAQIPYQLKFKNNNEKYIFLKTIENRLPDYILNHEKRGFGIPTAYWKETHWRQRIRTLHEQSSIVSDVLDISKIDSWDGALTWRALFLATWLVQWKDYEVQL